jgi:hypothetical protein
MVPRVKVEGYCRNQNVVFAPAEARKTEGDKLTRWKQFTSRASRRVWGLQDPNRRVQPAQGRKLRTSGSTAACFCVTLALERSNWHTGTSVAATKYFLRTEDRSLSELTKSERIWADSQSAQAGRFELADVAIGLPGRSRQDRK